MTSTFENQNLPNLEQKGKKEPNVLLNDKENETLNTLLRADKSPFSLDAATVNSLIAQLSPESIKILPLWQIGDLLKIYGNVLTEANKKLIQENMWIDYNPNQTENDINSWAFGSMESVNGDILRSAFQAVQETSLAMREELKVTEIPNEAGSSEKLEAWRLTWVVWWMETKVALLENDIDKKAPEQAKAIIAQEQAQMMS